MGSLCKKVLCLALGQVFLLLLRAAAPGSAWQAHQGLGFSLVPLFLRADCPDNQPTAFRLLL